MLVLFLVVGVCGGTWIQMISPVRQQWAAIEPFLDMGAQLETKPSNVPEWLEFLLEDGKTEDIEAIRFCWPNRYKPLSKTIESLKRLPHLKTLEIPSAELKPLHLKLIAELTQLEHLVVSANHGLAKADLILLANLKNLRTLDICNCEGQDWRTLLAFRENHQLTIGHSLKPEVMNSITACLLYTSPSPRDRG